MSRARHTLQDRVLTPARRLGTSSDAIGRIPDRAPLRVLAVLVVSAVMLVMAGPAPVSGQESDTPGKPTNLTGKVAHDAVTLTWDAPDGSTVTGYQILRRDRSVDGPGVFHVHVDDTGTADTTYTDTDVKAGAEYVYRVKARNGDAIGPQSSYFDANVPLPLVPDKPTGLTGTVTSDRVTLSWDDPQDDTITGYQVLRRDKAKHAIGEFLVHVDDTGSAETTYTDTDVEAGAEYVYRIKARNANGLSEQSSYLNADVPEQGGQKTIVQRQTGGICERTPEVRDWIVDQTDRDDCSAVTEADLNGITVSLQIEGYSNDVLLRSDFAGLTGVAPDISIVESPNLHTIPADALEEFSKTAITGVFLSRNGIISVQEGVFDGFSNLQSISFADNELKAIEGKLFSGLSKLRNIRLQHNRIAKIPEGIFDGLGSLGDLSLFQNNISELPDDLFAETPALRTLQLSDNNISALPSGIFEELGDMSGLNLHGNNLTSLAADVFSSFDNSLRLLDLSENNLNSLPAGLFDGLNGMRDLSLHDNNLTALPEDLFEPFDGDLRELRLSDNRIASLDADVFEGLTGLRELDLDGNALTALDEETFSPIGGSLVFLRLHDNLLSSLHEDTFDALTGLSTLSLQGNSLVTLPSDIFDDPSGLRGIFLADNELSSLPSDVFSGLNSLNGLDLSGNELTTLPAALLQPQDISLFDLNLADNNIGSLHADFFDGLGGLKFLDISGNALTSLETALFQDLDHRLEHLYLRNNSLTTLPSNIFRGLSGLKRLDLSCNSLTALNLSLLNPFASTLTYLDLGANDFSTAPSEDDLREKLTNIEALYLTGTAPCLSADNTGLSGLTVSHGTLTPAFEAPGQSGYFLTVPESVDTLTVNPVPSAANATLLQVFGGEREYNPNHSLVHGQNFIDWVVRSEDGGSDEGYAIEVYRAYPPWTNAHLQNIDMSDVELDEEFDIRTFDYSATVPSTVEQTQVTWVPVDCDATAMVMVDGEEAEDGMVDLKVGDNTVKVEVTAEDGVTKKSYTVVVKRQVDVSFEQSSYPVDEGDAVEITVTLSDSSQETITIPIAVIEVVATEDDYSGIPEELEFTSGETRKTFTFTAEQDTVDDDDERVTLSFGTLSSPVIPGSITETTINIIDDDDPEVTVRFERGMYSVRESDDALTTGIEENKATIKVILSADPERTVEIDIQTTNQGGASEADYTLAPTRVTFNPGETEQTITFTATNDTVDDDDESVRLTFINLPARVDEGSTEETVVHITDDDDPEITVSFKETLYSMPETDDPDTPAREDSVTVTLVLDQEPEREVEILITHAGQNGATPQGQPDSDYQGLPGVVRFAANQTEATFSFRASPDDVDDDGESVLLGFGLPLPDAVSPGDNPTATVNIIDDDDPEITVRFELDTYIVPESDDTNTPDVEENKATIKVILSADPERTVEIFIGKTNQDGATADDYTVAPTRVTFNPGETEQTITFTATNDTVDDDDESVRLTFINLPARVDEGSTEETVVHITDDDDPEVTVRFEQSAYSVEESDDTGTPDVAENTATIKVVLSADPERTVEIDIQTTNQGGASADDYTVAPTRVTFNPGETEQTITFTATNDEVDDDDESVLLSFASPLPGRVSEADANDEAVVYITDDEFPRVTIRFEEEAYSLAEGRSLAIKVILSADPERPVAIELQPTHLDGATGADYSLSPASVTFEIGETEKTVTIDPAIDSVEEVGEKVRLEFGTLPLRMSRADPDSATVEIVDARFTPIELAGPGDSCPVNWPLGMWTDGNNLYLIHNAPTWDGTNLIRGFSMETADMVSEVEAGHSEVMLTGLWSDGTAMWVPVYGENRLLAYGPRDSSKDRTLAPENTHALGMHMTGGILWVGDIKDEKVYAYDWATMEHLSDRDFPLTAGQNPDGFLRAGNLVGLWTDGVTLWATDDEDNRLYAYSVADGSRKPALDLETYPENRRPWAIASDGETMFVIDKTDCKVYRYKLPGT